jgi:hypothetical protein
MVCVRSQTSLNSAFIKSFPPYLGMRPDDKAIIAATADVPVALKHLADSGKWNLYLPNRNPQPDATIVQATRLEEMLALNGHSAWVSGWSIYRLVELGILGAEVVRTPCPPIEQQVGRAAISVVSYLVVWPTKFLREWWRHHPDAKFLPRKPAKPERVDRPGQSTIDKSPPRIEAADLTSFRPAKEFLGQHGIENHSQLSKFLLRHSDIRTRKPSKQRRLEHAGDWHLYWEKEKEERRQFDSLDRLGEDYIRAAMQRAATIRQEGRLKPRKEKQRIGDVMLEIMEKVESQARDEVRGRAREPGK